MNVEISPDLGNIPIALEPEENLMEELGIHFMTNEEIFGIINYVNSFSFSEFAKGC